MAKKNKRSMSDRAIRAMPYDSRIRRYNEEKDALFQNARGLPASELSRLHEELVKKWRV